LVQVQENYCTTEAANERAIWLVKLWKNHDIALPVTVKAAEAKGTDLNGLTDAELSAIDKRITKAVRDVLSVEASVASRTSFGGTAPANVHAAITAAGKAL
jgi:argininosuccinate lyase